MTVDAAPIPTDVPASPATARAPAIVCPVCRGLVDVKSKHVAVFDGAIRVYCSAECMYQRDAPPDEAAVPAAIARPSRRRRAWLLVPMFGVVGGAATWVAMGRDSHDAMIPPAPAISTTERPAEPQPPTVGDPRHEADAVLVAELARDAWIHPLAGPKRRMPVNHNGAFGAERPGERPPECVSGHCGVDLGNVWGERVYAVHEGVIDFVQRGPNEDRGGVFVRVAHRGGTLFSWYFHLAAVPRWIRPGRTVRAGTLLGLLGDTGVKSSAPHLHFALSVRTSKHVRERYLDPEPLIAIWPLWLPDGSGGGRLSTAPEPGMPVRATGTRRKRREADPGTLTDAAPVDAPAPGELATTDESTGAGN